MENFEYHTPTRLIFGKGIIDRLPEVMRPSEIKSFLPMAGEASNASGFMTREGTAQGF